MQLLTFLLTALVGSTLATPSGEAVGTLAQRACGSKYNSCGAPHQPPCCQGLSCAAGTCLPKAARGLDRFERRACGSENYPCGAPLQPACCGGLYCTSNTCLPPP
ncbi:hypothetical protein BDV25DRAFT_18297 [Aspergillus avenaceus]|uniref:Uncharacterized protein n=1 Tax=Aspergillus avenaceus TaxID=36643 RepID=A0A5N6U4Z1_ASPAV|nr:hypothetical protein BDV25DRAFT_18297 [Aspergillus avenaceus]